MALCSRESLQIITEMYTFRLRFLISDRSPIATEGTELQLPATPQGNPVILKAADGRTPIRESRWLAITSHGHPNREAALRAGSEYRGVLLRAFSKIRIAVDFGERAPRGSFTAEGLEAMGARSGRAVLNDEHGLMAFPTEPRPLLTSMTGGGIRLQVEGKGIADFVQDALVAERPSDREFLAYDLFSASFFEHSEDARLVLLMMAVESLLVLNERDAACQLHVQHLLHQTRAADHLDKRDQDAMCGTLEWLRFESINQAGKRLARTLEPRTYKGVSPVRFFTHAYSVRSALVHGRHPLPTRSEVGSVAATLEVFVGDLLAGPSMHKTFSGPGA